MEYNCYFLMPGSKGHGKFYEGEGFGEGQLEHWPSVFTAGEAGGLDAGEVEWEKMGRRCDGAAFARHLPSCRPRRRFAESPGGRVLGRRWADHGAGCVSLMCTLQSEDLANDEAMASMLTMISYGTEHYCSFAPRPLLVSHSDAWYENDPGGPGTTCAAMPESYDVIGCDATLGLGEPDKIRRL